MKSLMFGLFFIIITNCSCIWIHAYPDSSGNFNTFEIVQTGHPTTIFHDEGNRWRINQNGETIYFYELDFSYTDRKPTLILPLQDELRIRNIKIIGDARLISVNNFQSICNKDDQNQFHCICLSCTKPFREEFSQ